MYHILRDANRIWYLSPGLDAPLCEGLPVDPQWAQGILGNLILDPANLSAVQSALSAVSFPSSPLPAGIRALLDAMNRRLQNREWALLAGPARAAKAPAAPRGPNPELVPVERADWRSADDEPVETPEPALTIETGYHVEPYAALECGFEIDADGGLETGFEIEASEASPAGAPA